MTVRNVATNSGRPRRPMPDGHFTVIRLQPGHVHGRGHAQRIRSVQPQRRHRRSRPRDQSRRDARYCGSDRRRSPSWPKAPIINTEQSDFSTNINQTTIANLPVNTRRWSTFALMTPGRGAGRQLRPGQLPRHLRAAEQQHGRRRRQHAGVLRRRARPHAPGLLGQRRRRAGVPGHHVELLGRVRPRRRRRGQRRHQERHQRALTGRASTSSATTSGARATRSRRRSLLRQRREHDRAASSRRIAGSSSAAPSAARSRRTRCSSSSATTSRRAISPASRPEQSAQRSSRRSARPSSTTLPVARRQRGAGQRRPHLPAGPHRRRAAHRRPDAAPSRRSTGRSTTTTRSRSPTTGCAGTRRPACRPARRRQRGVESWGDDGGRTTGPSGGSTRCSARRMTNEVRFQWGRDFEFQSSQEPIPGEPVAAGTDRSPGGQHPGATPVCVRQAELPRAPLVSGRAPHRDRRHRRRCCRARTSSRSARTSAASPTRSTTCSRKAASTPTAAASTSSPTTGEHRARPDGPQLHQLQPGRRPDGVLVPHLRLRRLHPGHLARQPADDAEPGPALRLRADAGAADSEPALAAHVGVPERQEQLRPAHRRRLRRSAGDGNTVIRGGYGMFYGRIINSTISNAITNVGVAAVSSR